MRCDTCGTALRDTDPRCETEDGALCLACAPMLSDVLRIHEAMLALPRRWIPFDAVNREELADAIAILRAMIAECGDRKAVWPGEARHD